MSNEESLDIEEVGLPPFDPTAMVARLNRDIMKAVVTMSPTEARFLVDLYYSSQHDRMALANQTRSMAEEPHKTLSWFQDQSAVMEQQLKRALNGYAKSQPLGEWAMAIDGIGPVLASGLMAYVDVEEARTAGAVWRFAGLDPTMKWIGRDGSKRMIEDIEEELDDEVDSLNDVVARAAVATNRDPERTLMQIVAKYGEEFSSDDIVSFFAKRPWNASFKVLCWKIGESFVKIKNKPGEAAFYGRLYDQRKAIELANNSAGKYAEQAKTILLTKRIGKSTDAYKAYSIGQLPPGHIHSRCKRYATKLFLSHYWEVGRRLKGLDIPKPFAIAHMGHTHELRPPFMDRIEFPKAKE